MSKVYLKDVVTRIKDKVDKDNTDLEYYIGGEHFDNGEIQITKKGVIAGSTIGPAFHMRFVPGDVLLISKVSVLTLAMFAERRMKMSLCRSFYRLSSSQMISGNLRRKTKRVPPISF